MLLFQSVSGFGMIDSTGEAQVGSAGEQPTQE